VGPQNGLYCIIDARVTCTDDKSNRSKDTAKVLAAHEWEIKRSINSGGLVERSSSAHDQSEHRKHKHNIMVLEVDQVAMLPEDGNFTAAAKLL
jgi:hypothetical protein